MSGADVHVEDRVTGTWVLGVGNTSRNAPAERGVFNDFTRGSAKMSPLQSKTCP